MAIYFLNVKSFGRSGGSNAVSAAAYRSGERLHDERGGRTYDHSARQDVLHKEIVLPSRFADADMSWALDRGNLWNSAERVEPRSNSRVAREFLVALPVELSPERRVELARGFSQELTERYGFAVDLAVHAARDFPGSDPRNVHAHLLATTREVSDRGLTAKTTLEMHDARRREAGLQPGRYELLHVRERWATVTNEALRNAHIEARIDHRSLAAQGIDREPRPHIPRAAFEMERHGHRSFVAERIRADHATRVAARAAAGAATEQSAAQRPAPARALPQLPATPEELRSQAVENWLRYKREHGIDGRQDGAAQAAQNWAKYRREHGSDYEQDGAAQAAQNWAKFRREHGSDHGQNGAAQAAQNWARYRREHAAGREQNTDAATERGAARSRDDDYGL